MIAHTAAALRAGTTTCVELAQAAIGRADELDSRLGVYITRFDEKALRTAEALDVELAAGIDRGPLHGLPIAIKDNIAACDGPTTAQSTVLDPAWGEGRDAPVVARLRAAGGVVLGKTTMHEFAIGHPDPLKRFPESRNPWAPDCYAGGSSSGSAVGVAADMFPIALGTDTGGSLRIPAALCGVTALMPTYGRVPLSGCVPLSFTIDRIGPITRSAQDAATVLEVMAGWDPSDPTAAEHPVDGYAAGLSGSLDGVRIGVERRHHFPEGCDPAVRPAFEEAVANLSVAGAELCEVTLPHWEEAVAAHSVIEGAESLAYHRQDLQARWSEYTPWTRLAFSRGALVSGADYVQAQRVRRVVQRALWSSFKAVDLIVMPTLGTAAVPLESLYASTGSVLALFEFIFTRYWNCVGNPVLSLPMGFTSSGLPLGMQIAGRPFEEALVLRAGDTYQRYFDWHLRRPQLTCHAEQHRKEVV